MSNFEALVLAIRKHPGDWTPRLVYADFLEEERAGDPAALATVEFLRVACKPARGPWAMPKEAYAWWRANWKRLIPRVLALSIPITEPSDRWPDVPEGGMYAEATASEVDTYITLAVDTSRRGTTGYEVWFRKLYSCRFRMWMSGGMVHQWKMPSPFGRERVEPALRQDQPHLFVEDVQTEAQVVTLPPLTADAAG